MRVSSEGAWDLRVATTGRVRVSSGWDHLRIFEIMRVKVRESTCERARGESVLKSACESASESACE